MKNIKKYLILAAMDEEIDFILKHLGDNAETFSSEVPENWNEEIASTIRQQQVHFQNLTNKIRVDFYFEGNKNFILYIVKTGIGKVNAAMNTTIAIEITNPDHIINVGLAGGVASDLKIMDVVLADKVVYHDVDATNFGYKFGQVPQEIEFFQTDALTNDLLLKIIEEKTNHNVKIGLIGSGDQFVTDSSGIVEKFPDMVALDMETCSIAHVAHKFNIPFNVIRTISDLAHEESTIEFEKILLESIVSYAHVIEGLEGHK